MCDVMESVMSCMKETDMTLLPHSRRGMGVCIHVWKMTYTTLNTVGASGDGVGNGAAKGDLD